MRKGRTEINSDLSVNSNTVKPDVTDINAMLNAFRIANVGSLTQFSMVDGITDEYEDESGVNTGASIEQSYDATDDFYSPAAQAEIKLLLNFNGANGDTTTTDESASAHSVALVSDAHLNGEGKFGIGCLELDGVNQYLTFTDSPDWDIAGSTSDSWTIGTWVRFSDLGSTEQFIGQQVNGSNFWGFTHISDDTFRFRVNDAGDTYILMNGGAVSDNDWHYMTVCKVGNDWGMYVDGIQVAFDTEAVKTTTYAAELQVGGASFSGQYLKGYMDEVYISQSNHFSAAPNVGLTDTITIPTSAHTTDVNSKLLLHLDYNFSNSASGEDAVIVNDAHLTATKFGTTSLALDGTGDYLTAPTSTDFDVLASNASNHTVDLFFKHSEVPAQTEMYIIYSDAGGTKWWRLIHVIGEGIRWNAKDGSNIINTQGLGEITDTNWHHLAMCKVGTKSGMYLDGIQLYYAENSSELTVTSGELRIGIDNLGNNGMNGNIDGVRIIESNEFNAAPMPLPYAHYKLNDGANNGTILDSGTGANNGAASFNTDSHNIFAIGKIDESKLGTGAGYFDGTLSVINIPDHADWDFGTGDFTIDTWFKLDDNPITRNDICGQRVDSNNRWWVGVNADSGSGHNIDFFSNSGGVQTGYFRFNPGNLEYGTWYHLAFVRDGSTPRWFLDGVPQSVTTFTAFGTLPNLAATLNVGAVPNNSYYWDGQLDEFRISDTARWTSDFSGSLPSVAYTSDSNTRLLLHLDGDVTDSGNTGHTPIDGCGFGAINFGGTHSINIDALEADIDSDTTGTFAFWVYSDDTTIAVQEIIAFGDTNADTYLKGRIVGSDQRIYFTSSIAGGGATQWTVRGNTALADDTWYHVAIVQDGTSPKIYIDGVDETVIVNSDDLTVWFSDMESALDNGRIGCRNSNSSGDISFLDGRLDDFRYYQNQALTASEISVLYNSGNGTENPGDSITVPTSEANVQTQNMTLISEAFTAEAQADNCRIVVFEEDIDSITLNTDLIASISRDGGVTYTQATLVDEGNYESGRKILSAQVDISGQPTGTDMQYKIVTANNKELKIHGTGLSWD